MCNAGPPDRIGGPSALRATWQDTRMLIRPAGSGDANAIWAIMEPIIRAARNLHPPRDMTKASALAYWLSDEREVFVAEDNGEVVGTYCLRANQKGGGAHVANCGYMTAVSATGRGVARAMCGAFAGPSAGARIPRDAIQLRDQHQRACRTAVAEFWL